MVVLKSIVFDARRWSTDGLCFRDHPSERDKSFQLGQQGWNKSLIHDTGFPHRPSGNATLCLENGQQWVRDYKIPS